MLSINHVRNLAVMPVSLSVESTARKCRYDCLDCPQVQICNELDAIRTRAISDIRYMFEELRDIERENAIKDLRVMFDDLKHDVVSPIPILSEQDVENRMFTSELIMKHYNLKVVA